MKAIVPIALFCGIAAAGKNPSPGPPPPNELFPKSFPTEILDTETSTSTWTPAATPTPELTEVEWAGLLDNVTNEAEVYKDAKDDGKTVPDLTHAEWDSLLENVTEEAEAYRDGNDNGKEIADLTDAQLDTLLTNVTEEAETYKKAPPSPVKAPHAITEDQTLVVTDEHYAALFRNIIEAAKAYEKIYPNGDEGPATPVQAKHRRFVSPELSDEHYAALFKNVLDVVKVYEHVADDPDFKGRRVPALVPYPTPALGPALFPFPAPAAPAQAADPAKSIPTAPASNTCCSQNLEDLSQAVNEFRRVGASGAHLKEAFSSLRFGQTGFSADLARLFRQAVALKTGDGPDAPPPVTMNQDPSVAALRGLFDAALQASRADATDKMGDALEATGIRLPNVLNELANLFRSAAALALVAGQEADKAEKAGGGYPWIVATVGPFSVQPQKFGWVAMETRQQGPWHHVHWPERFGLGG